MVRCSRRKRSRTAKPPGRIGGSPITFLASCLDGVLSRWLGLVAQKSASVGEQSPALGYSQFVAQNRKSSPPVILAPKMPGAPEPATVWISRKMRESVEYRQRIRDLVLSATRSKSPIPAKRAPRSRSPIQRKKMQIDVSLASSKAASAVVLVKTLSEGIHGKEA